MGSRPVPGRTAAARRASHLSGKTAVGAKPRARVSPRRKRPKAGAPPFPEDGLDPPGTDNVGLAGRGRLVPPAKPLEEETGEGVGMKSRRFARLSCASSAKPRRLRFASPIYKDGGRPWAG